VCISFSKVEVEGDGKIPTLEILETMSEENLLDLFKTSLASLGKKLNIKLSDEHLFEKTGDVYDATISFILRFMIHHYHLEKWEIVAIYESMNASSRLPSTKEVVLPSFRCLTLFNNFQIAYQHLLYLTCGLGLDILPPPSRHFCGKLFSALYMQPDAKNDACKLDKYPRFNVLVAGFF
jgi:hypothetical protein